MDANLLPTVIEQLVIQEEMKEDEEDVQIPQNMSMNGREHAFIHRNDECLQKSEEWYNKALEELSKHVSNLCDMWKDVLEHHKLILEVSREHFHHNVDVMTEIRLVEGMMVMNGFKPTNHSDDKLSRFIDLIAKTIHTDVLTQHFVQASTISIPVEFLSQTNNDDDGMHYYVVVGDNEEVEDQTEDGQGQGQETVITQPVDQQPNSSQRSLRSGTRENDRQMNDFYSRESRAALAGNGGSGMDEDRALA